jgi:hypothetical protein
MYLNDVIVDAVRKHIHIHEILDGWCKKTKMCKVCAQTAGVVLIIRTYTRVHVSSYRVSVSPAAVIRHELTQALTWHCLYSVRHVDHRRRRSRTSAVPVRSRPRHLGRDTAGGARRQAATAASVCSDTKQRGIQLSLLIRHLDRLTAVFLG